MQDLNDKVTGGSLTAAEWNEVPSEIQNVIESIGQVLSGADLSQLLKAIAGYAANGTYYIDSGIADAYVLSTVGSKAAPHEYSVGERIRYVVGNTNTGASTVNRAGGGVKALELFGNSMPAGALAAGALVEAEYDGTAYQLRSPTSAKPASMADMDFEGYDGQSLKLISFHALLFKGSGDWVYKADEDTANHNGGTIRDPRVVYDASWTPTTRATYFTALPGNTGCWVRLEDGPINVRIFGDKGDGVTDDYDSMQNAIALGKSTVIPDDTHMTTAELVSDTLGQLIEGEGEGSTKISGTHSAGAVIRFKKAYSGISNISIVSSGLRALSSDPSGYGVHFEPDDLPRNPVTLEGYLYNTEIGSIEVTDQPSTGLYVAGGVLNASTIDRFRVHSNRGHGLHIERGYLRTNPGDAIGLCNLNHGVAFGNSGHGIVVGNPGDTTTTQAIRVQFNNIDTGNNALSAGVRFSAHQNWITGTGMEWLDSYASDSQAVPTTGGLFIQGTNNHITSFRTNDVFPMVEVGPNVAALFSNGTYINGLNALTTDIVDLDPAVVVHANAKNTHVSTKDYSGIATLVTSSARGLSVGNDSVTFKKISDQSVNNSIALVGIDQLTYFATEEEEGYFELFIEYTSVALANIKLDFTVPAGSQFRWSTSDGRINDTSGTRVDQLLLSSAVTTMSAFADTNRRSLFIKGYFRTLGTGGLIQPRFAQDSAVVGDTTIKTPTSYFKVEKIAPLS